MERELDAIDVLIDEYAEAEGLAKAAATKHKNITSSETAIHMNEGGITKAKEKVQAEPGGWLKRQLACDELLVAASVKRMKMEQAIRRWETSRSVYSATRKVT